MKNLENYRWHKDSRVPEAIKQRIKAESESKLLIRCPKCHLENYAMTVTSGICVWCGYDSNKEDENA